MWGGAEIWLMDIMHGLQDRGHQVSLICRPGTILEKNALFEGFDVTTLKMNSDFDIKAIFKIRKLLKEKKIQLISTNMDKELRIGGIAAKLAGNIAVVPSREVDYPLKNKLRYRFTYNYLADHIIANSFSTKKTLLKEAPWLSPDKIEVIYKGINPHPYIENSGKGKELRKELKISDSEKVIGFVGQIIERKGINDILKSIPGVVEKIPDVKYLFAGEGKLESFLKSEIKRMGIEKNVLFAGFRKDIPSVMNAVDLLILPSVVEGFGYVLVEAMAAGKPVVATNVSSIPEIVLDKKTGILIDVHQPEQLAEAVLKILENKDAAKEMGILGKERVLQNFTIDKMIANTEAVFLKQINKING
jgi:glycosyltransferase involved in cell wall biosynthesis